MKKILFFFSCYMIPCLLFSQITTEGFRKDLADMSKYSAGAKSNGYEGLQSFSSGEVKGSQFYFPTWTAGSLLTPTNTTDASNYLFLYDKVRQVLFMKANAAAEVLEVSKDKIHGFTLMYNGTHQFAVASEYDPTNRTDFYELLVKNDSDYTLLKSVKTKFVKFDPTDMVKMKSGETADEYDDNITYYVSYKHGQPQEIKIKDGNIKKVMASDKSKVVSYLDENYATERNEDFLTGLVRSVNS